MAPLLRALLLCGHHRFRGRPQVVVRAEKRPSRLLVDAGAVHLTGIDGADILIHVEEEEFPARGTTLALSGVPVLVPWARAGVIEAMGDRNVFDSAHDALRAPSDSRPEVQREPARGATP